MGYFSQHTLICQHTVGVFVHFQPIDSTRCGSQDWYVVCTLTHIFLSVFPALITVIRDVLSSGKSKWETCAQRIMCTDSIFWFHESEQSSILTGFQTKYNCCLLFSWYLGPILELYYCFELYRVCYHSRTNTYLFIVYTYPIVVYCDYWTTVVRLCAVRISLVLFCLALRRNSALPSTRSPNTFQVIFRHTMFTGVSCVFVKHCISYTVYAKSVVSGCCAADALRRIHRIFHFVIPFTSICSVFAGILFMLFLWNFCI